MKTSPKTTESKPRKNLVLTLVLPCDVLSRNEANVLHWAEKAKTRMAWSIFLARCMLKLYGACVIKDPSSTMTIFQGAVKSYAMLSLPRSGSKAIQKKMGLPSSTSKKSTGKQQKYKSR